MSKYVSKGPAEPGGEEVYVLGDNVSTASLADITPDIARSHAGVEPLDSRTDLANHSPSGFSWGYRGSGPAQLALAILAHHTDDQYALDNYQLFKERYVAKQSADERFEATGREIDEVMKR